MISHRYRVMRHEAEAAYVWIYSDSTLHEDLRYLQIVYNPAKRGLLLFSWPMASNGTLCGRMRPYFQEARFGSTLYQRNVNETAVEDNKDLNIIKIWDKYAPQFSRPA